MTTDAPSEMVGLGPYGEMDVWLNHHTRPIYDLLANGVNVKVTLIKEDGDEYSYRLRDGVVR